MYLLDCLELYLNFLLKTGLYHKRKVIDADFDIFKSQVYYV